MPKRLFDLGHWKNAVSQVVDGGAMELWKTVKDYPMYQVSNCGRVKSCRGLGGRWDILNGYLSNNSYIQQWLVGPPSKLALVHRLVLETFVGPCPDGMECNHIDGIKTHNWVTNLEWVTRSQNCLHAHRIGLHNGRGRKLKDGEAWLLKKMLYYKVPRLMISKMFEVSYDHVCDIAQGGCWSHITYESEESNA